MDEPKPRLRLFFSLSNLLILTAGLAIGMAAMQPWRTWEPDPIEVAYDVKVIRAKLSPSQTSAERAKVLTEIGAIFTPNKTTFAPKPANMELLGESTLSAMTKSEAAYELANASPGSDASKLDSFQIKLKPDKAEGQIVSLIEGRLYWANEKPELGKTSQWISSAFSVQPGATQVIELHLNSKSPQGKDGLRYFVVVTPSLVPKFRWVASNPGGKATLQKTK